MDIKHLELFRKLPLHEDLIEIKDMHGHRWLFATNGVRAIGIQTTETVVNCNTRLASSLQSYVNRDNLIKLDRQHFMAFLHSTEENSICAVCNDTKKVECDECNGEGTVDCDECDGNGIVEKPCEDCDGDGRLEKDCKDCDGAGHQNKECSNCSGSGTVEIDCTDCDGCGFIEEESDGKETRLECKKCVGKCTIEESCEECEDGYVEEECSECEGSGRIEEDCENCYCGTVEEDCEECDGGRIDCNVCDEDQQQTCTECENDPKDIGEVYCHRLDLSLLKDLSMDFFEEVHPAPETGHDEFITEPIVFRGNGVMAIIMPGRFSGNFRKYEAKKV